MQPVCLQFVIVVFPDYISFYFLLSVVIKRNSRISLISLYLERNKSSHIYDFTLFQNFYKTQNSPLLCNILFYFECLRFIASIHL